MAENTNGSEYFASKTAKDTVAILEKKIEGWSQAMKTNGLMEKIRKSWYAYHGIFSDDDGHQLGFGGAQGELVKMPVNHYRNIAQHLLNMTTSNRPSMKTRAANTDYASQSQTILADGLLEYYMREKRLERQLKYATELTIVMGEGYIKQDWDATSGEVYEINPDTKAPVYEGDIKYTVFSPFDVVRDVTKEDMNDPDWLICRSYVNRYDLMAQYPELKAEIERLPGKNSATKPISGTILAYETDDVEIWVFYHSRTAAMPDGRYLMFCTQDTVFVDTPLPYRNIPVHRISPSNILGTPFGYTVMFDCMPIQEAINMLYSIVLSNQNAFGVQNIAIPKDANIALSSLFGGLNIIEYDRAAGAPQPLNLTQTPVEIFNMIGRLESVMETISGINNVTRGNPPPSLQTGAALALIQSQAVQFAAGLQHSYVQLLEDVCTTTIKILQDFASVPRVAAISGISNRSKMVEFTGQSINSISRVIVEVSNPLAKTTAGRLEIANQLLQMKLVKNVNQYFTVLNTGRLDSVFEGDQQELLNIKRENEEMMDGQLVAVLPIDEHRTHILEHRSLLADPMVRRNPELVRIVLDHIQEHVNQLRTVDPALLQLLGQEALPPVAAEASVGVSPAVPDAQASGQVVQDTLQQLPVGPPIDGIQQPTMPEPATPPPPFQDLPTTVGDITGNNE